LFKYRIFSEDGTIIALFWYRWVIMGISNVIILCNVMIILCRSFYKWLELAMFMVGSYACFALQYYLADHPVAWSMFGLGVAAHVLGGWCYLMSVYEASKCTRKSSSICDSYDEFSEDGAPCVSDHFASRCMISFVVYTIVQVLVLVLGQAGSRTMSLPAEQLTLLIIDVIARINHIFDVNYYSAPTGPRSKSK
jgi:hypothetical protein